jgi:hypothetical protein
MKYYFYSLIYNLLKIFVFYPLMLIDHILELAFRDEPVNMNWLRAIFLFPYFICWGAMEGCLVRMPASKIRKD